MLTLLILLIGTLPFLAKRLLRYLHVFQLEEYDTSRLFAWLWNHRVFDKRGSIIFLTTSLLLFFNVFPHFASFTATCTLLAIAYFEPDPRKLAKVSLKLTDRAKRIYVGTCILTIVLEAIMCSLFFHNSTLLWLSQIIVIQSLPFLLAAACRLLRSDEQRRQDNFQHEAQRILAEVNPYIIGITGSYGKTSTKEALACILQVSLGPTFWTPKSINTVMGITREIRTNLKTGTKYAIMEMGAYRPGSIDRLCRFTPPQAAIITCVGLAHLERFGTPENIYLAKSELAQNVPSKGILVCNGDDLGARKMAQEHPKAKVFLYGLHPEKGHLDAWITDIKTTPQGTEFITHWQSTAYHCFTPLVGATALSNALGSFTMACALGANPALALGVIRNLQPVDNRLELRKEGGITYLRDAYNSNPSGFRAALDVLHALPSNRKILMTPGMIELGTEQAAKNEEMGQHAASICDIALIVGETNREALEKGIKKGGMDPTKVYRCATREDAFAQLRLLAKEGDTILIENDLTDLYVTPKKF